MAKTYVIPAHEPATAGFYPKVYGLVVDSAKIVYSRYRRRKSKVVTTRGEADDIMRLVVDNWLRKKGLGAAIYVKLGEFRSMK